MPGKVYLLSSFSSPVSLTQSASTSFLVFDSEGDKSVAVLFEDAKLGASVAYRMVAMEVGSRALVVLSVRKIHLVELVARKDRI